MAGLKSPWDPRRANDEKWENTFSSERLYDLCDIKVQRMGGMNQAQGTIFSRKMITEKNWTY
jgi:hypothetical protein